MNAHEAWPKLEYAGHEDDIATLHLWTQIVGKLRLARTPWLNHSWHVPLYVTVRGLGTGLVPYEDGRAFEVIFDFHQHELVINTTAGERESLELRPRSVAEFYEEVKRVLDQLQIDIAIHELPNEIPDAIPFPEDTTHRSYDQEFARSLWLALVQIDRVFYKFRTGFLGKSSPVHFFWGSFDMAVTRFSGREAPPHPGGFPNLPDPITREAYSHEVSSAGFFLGGGGVEEPMFYSYAYPTPEGFGDAAVKPEAAYFFKDLGEFVLPYEAVRTAPDPDAALLEFLQSTYEAAANLAKWDRAALECEIGEPRVPREA